MEAISSSREASMEFWMEGEVPLLPGPVTALPARRCEEEEDEEAGGILKQAIGHAMTSIYIVD